MSTSTDTSLVDYSLKEMKDVRKKNAKKALEGVYDVSLFSFVRLSNDLVNT